MLLSVLSVVVFFFFFFRGSSPPNIQPLINLIPYTLFTHCCGHTVGANEKYVPNRFTYDDTVAVRGANFSRVLYDGIPQATKLTLRESHRQ